MHERVKGNKLILFTEKMFLFTVQSKMRFIQKCLSVISQNFFIISQKTIKNISVNYQMHYIIIEI